MPATPQHVVRSRPQTPASALEAGPAERGRPTDRPRMGMRGAAQAVPSPTPCTRIGPLAWEALDPRIAQRACSGCPARWTCLRDALHASVHGVAGGLTAAERDEWREVLGITVDTEAHEQALPLQVRVADARGTDRLARARLAALFAEVDDDSLSPQELAERLGVSERTVHRHRAARRAGAA